MARDPDEAGPAFPLGLDKGFQRTVGAENLLDLFRGPDIEHLPKIEMIHLHVPEGQRQMVERSCFGPGV